MKLINKTICVGLLATMAYAGSLSAADMQGYFADFVLSAVLHDVNATTAGLSVPPANAACGSTPKNNVFGVGYTGGLAYNGAGTLYGLDWSAGTAGSPIFLYTFANPAGCATGTRVGATAIGPVNLESLAFCADNTTFYSVDWDAATPHLGQLLFISAATGIGTLIGGHMTFDRRVVGMVCDASGQLWAVTSGFATKLPELLKINRTTGVETLVGALGVAANQVESLAADPGDTTKLFSAGKALYEINKTTGAASQVGVVTFGQFWAMAGAAAATPVELSEYSVE